MRYCVIGAGILRSVLSPFFKRYDVDSSKTLELKESDAAGVIASFSPAGALCEKRGRYRGFEDSGVWDMAKGSRASSKT